MWQECYLLALDTTRHIKQQAQAVKLAANGIQFVN
jgi:hypothetical protein